LFQLFATSVNDTGGKFAAGVVDTSGNLPPASLTPAANFPLVSTTQGELVAKFAAGVIDTGGKFLREFSKKFEMILMLLSGAWGKVIHKKNLKQKIS
jgi:hypothetical protein